jgi:hypothetical protein
MCLLAEFLGGFLEGILTARDQENPGPLCDQLLGDGPAKPAARAAYHEGLVVQT